MITDKYQTFRYDEMAGMYSVIKGVRRDETGQFYGRAVKIPYNIYIDLEQVEREFLLKAIETDIEFSLYSEDRALFKADPGAEIWVEDIPEQLVQFANAELEQARLSGDMDESAKNEAERLEKEKAEQLRALQEYVQQMHQQTYQQKQPYQQLGGGQLATSGVTYPTYEQQLAQQQYAPQTAPYNGTGQLNRTVTTSQYAPGTHIQTRGEKRGGVLTEEGKWP